MELFPVVLEMQILLVLETKITAPSGHLQPTCPVSTTTLKMQMKGRSLSVFVLGIVTLVRTQAGEDEFVEVWYLKTFSCPESCRY